MALPVSSSDRMRALGASLIFLLVEPGTIAVLVPWIISRWRVHDWSGDVLFRPVGSLLIVAGGLVLVEAFARFALEGLGTPAPVYPTNRLIVRGTYRFVRNPMYLAVEAIILGQAAFFGSTDLVIYGAMMGVAFYFFVVWVEEPTLRRSYPANYRRYVDNVQRWVPRLTPWRP